MEELPEVQNPYAHMKLAHQLEESHNIRGAELEWKSAVCSADSLPLAEYRQTMKVELLRYQTDASYQVQPGVNESALRHAYSEVLALPFIARIELASFYARYGAYPEAQDACEEAFSTPPEATCLLDPRVSELHRRGTLMRQTLADTVGPDEMERLFKENFGKLDRDHNGYVHHSELERAQFDLTLSPECQLLIRHLLCHYFDVEAAHNDEWGVDINGISLRDMKAYTSKRNSEWKRMSKNETPPPHRHW